MLSGPKEIPYTGRLYKITKSKSIPMSYKVWEGFKWIGG